MESREPGRLSNPSQIRKLNQGPYGCFGGSSPGALSGFVKFHPQYPVLKVPGGACGPPCASRSRLARRCILRASPPRVKGKFGFGRNYSGARADSAEPSGFSQLAQSLPRGPCRPSLWRSLHNRGERGRASRRDSPGGARPRPADPAGREDALAAESPAGRPCAPDGVLLYPTPMCARGASHDAATT